MRIVGIVQARMGSNRLPGKVLLEVDGKPLLQYQIERMLKASLLDDLVIATTKQEIEEPIIKFCEQLGIPCYRGSENDVLDRYFHAAKHFKSDVIVRMTSDCPIIDPTIIDKVIQFYLDNQFDYVSNTQTRTFPRGMDTEVFSMTLLEKAYFNARKQYEREHVTPYFYMNPEKFSIGQVVQKQDFSHLRLTVDTNEDFRLISILIKDLYSQNPNFDLQAITDMFVREPNLIKINQHIIQKRLGE